MIYCTASRAYVITICVPVLSFDTASLPAGNTGLEKLNVLVVSESLKRDLQYTEQPIGRYASRRAFFAIVTCSERNWSRF